MQAYQLETLESPITFTEGSDYLCHLGLKAKLLLSTSPHKKILKN